MSCHDKDKTCHPYPIEPAPFAPGGCDPHPPCPPRPPRPPFKPGCPPSQYIGSRYVPIFADPIEWDKSKAYESLTIVVYNGESYTSRCNVAPGIDITNTTYWAKTGAYNAILEQYRTEVSDLSSQVTGFAADNKEFREKIDGYDADNTAMKETLADYTGKVDKLTERVTEAETDIGALQATTAQHTKDIADLKAKDSDLQAQITANDTDIASINDHQAEQDSRMDGIESVNRQQAEAIAKNASDIAAETTRASAAEVANGKLIARNAEELADHAEELADHEKRITALETDNVTNKADIRANAAKNVAQDAEIAAAKDAAAHAQETADRAETKANANSATIGSWEANHPGKTISQAVTDANADIVSANTQITNVKNGLSQTNENVTNLQNNKADKTALRTVSETASSAKLQATNNLTTIGKDWAKNHNNQSIDEAVSSLLIGVNNANSLANQSMTTAYNAQNAVNAIKRPTYISAIFPGGTITALSDSVPGIVAAVMIPEYVDYDKIDWAKCVVSFESADAKNRTTISSTYVNNFSGGLAGVSIAKNTNSITSAMHYAVVTITCQNTSDVGKTFPTTGLNIKLAYSA